MRAAVAMVLPMHTAAEEMVFPIQVAVAMAAVPVVALAYSENFHRWLAPSGGGAM